MSDETCSSVGSRNQGGCKPAAEADPLAAIGRLKDAQPPHYGAVAISLADRDAILARIELLEEVAHGRAIAIDMGNREEDRLIDRIAAVEAERDDALAWVNDLHSGMYVNCVYCGLRYGPADKTAPTMSEQLTAHVEVCPKHPLSAAKRRIAALEGALRGVIAEADRSTDAFIRAHAVLKERTNG